MAVGGGLEDITRQHDLEEAKQGGFVGHRGKGQPYGQQPDSLCPGFQQASNNCRILVLLTLLTLPTPTNYHDPIAVTLLRQPQNDLYIVIGHVSHCNLRTNFHRCLRNMAYLLLVSMVMSSRQLSCSKDDVT
jgi:hypothetical protein